MGKIGVVLKLMPESPETDLEAIKEEARDRIDVSDIGEEDVAFGLTAVMVSTVYSQSRSTTSRSSRSGSHRGRACIREIACIQGIRTPRRPRSS